MLRKSLTVCKVDLNVKKMLIYLALLTHVLGYLVESFRLNVETFVERVLNWKPLVNFTSTKCQIVLNRNDNKIMFRFTLPLSEKANWER